MNVTLFQLFTLKTDCFFNIKPKQLKAVIGFCTPIGADKLRSMYTVKLLTNVVVIAYLKELERILDPKNPYSFEDWLPADVARAGDIADYFNLRAASHGKTLLEVCAENSLDHLYVFKVFSKGTYALFDALFKDVEDLIRKDQREHAQHARRGFKVINVDFKKNLAITKYPSPDRKKILTAKKVPV